MTFECALLLVSAAVIGAALMFWWLSNLKP